MILTKTSKIQIFPLLILIIELYVCVCVCVRGRGSKNTNKGIKDSVEEMNFRKHQQNALEKIQATLCKCRKTTMDKNSEDANMLLESLEPRLKVFGCKPRVKRDTWH